MVVYPDGVWYRCTTKEEVDLVIDQHLIGNEPVETLKI